MRLSLACSPGSVRAPPNNPNRIQTLRFPISLPLSALGAERGFMAALSFLCAGIGVGHRAGGILVRPQDCLLGVGFPLIEIAALHIVELHLQNARLLPLAVRPECKIADDCLDRVFAQPVSELVLIEALRPLDRRLAPLQIGVGERRQIITNRLDTLAATLA